MVARTNSPRGHPAIVATRPRIPLSDHSGKQAPFFVWFISRIHKNILQRTRLTAHNGLIHATMVTGMKHPAFLGGYKELLIGRCPALSSS